MEYIETVNRKLDEIRQREDIVILAIESSCDETAVAITKGRQLLANAIASQIDIHKRFGGVVQAGQFVPAERNGHRLLWSNDGLMFVTYDHYETFLEII